MGFLETIWMVSIVLAISSLLVMGVLIILRVFRDMAKVRYTKRRKDLEGVFFSALQDPSKFDDIPLSNADRLMLAEIAYDLSASVKGNILKGIESVLIRYDVEQALLKTLTSSDPDKRILTINGLSMFHTRGAFDAVWQILSDPDPNVRVLAARIIVASPYPFDAHVFTETVELGTVLRSREVRPIVVGLAERDPHGVLRAIKTTDNPERRVFLIYGLGRSGCYDMVDDIVEFTFSENVNERAESLRALSALKHPAAAGAIRYALRDSAWEVRAQAAQAAADIGLPAVQSTLEKMLTDDVWWVRYRAAESLWQLGGGARARLLAHAHDLGTVGNITQLIIAEQGGVVSP